MRPRFFKTFLALGALLCATALGAAAPPRWQKVKQQGDVPPPVWDAGLTFVQEDPASIQPDTAYRFGGQRGTFPNEFTVKEFYALDLDTATWTRLTSRPSPRSDSLLIPGPCAGCVSVFGGRGLFRTGADHMFPDMLTYRPASGLWSRVPAERLGDASAIRRSSSLVVKVPHDRNPRQDTYYIFGGVGNTLPRFLTTPTGLRNDLAVYDPDTGWSLVETSGTKPVPRAWSAGAYNPTTNSILIFGGYRLGEGQGPDTTNFFGPANFENDLWSLSLDTFTWTRLQPQGPLPSGRDNAAAFFDTSRDGLVVFGGQGANGLSNELWFYSVAENRWSQAALASGSPIPRPRVGAVFFVRETGRAFELYLHSGSTGGEAGSTTFLNDLWNLTWPKD